MKSIICSNPLQPVVIDIEFASVMGHITLSEYFESKEIKYSGIVAADIIDPQKREGWVRTRYSQLVSTQEAREFRSEYGKTLMFHSISSKKITTWVEFQEVEKMLKVLDTPCLNESYRVALNINYLMQVQIETEIREREIKRVVLESGKLFKKSVKQLSFIQRDNTVVIKNIDIRQNDIHKDMIKLNEIAVTGNLSEQTVQYLNNF